MNHTNKIHNKEKRYSTRMWLNQPITFTDPLNKQKYSGVLKNISTGGLSFTSTHAVRQYDKIIICLYQEQTLNKFTLRVLRVSQHDENNYLIACKINGRCSQ